MLVLNKLLRNKKYNPISLECHSLRCCFYTCTCALCCCLHPFCLCLDLFVS